MKIMYMGASPEEETTFQGVRYIFPKGLAVDVPQALIDDGILNDPDFEAADEEAQEYVPVPPTTRKGMFWRSDQTPVDQDGTPLPVVKGAEVAGATDGQTTTVTDGELSPHNPLTIDPTQAPYNVKMDRLTYTTASMSSSSNPTHLTVTGYTFTTSDIGKHVKVVGAAAAGANLKTTITGVSSGKAVLASPCLTTVSGAYCIFGTDNLAALNQLFADLSSTSRTRKLSRAATFPMGVAMYFGTLILPYGGSVLASSKNWQNYDSIYSRSGGTENNQGTVFYQGWDCNADGARVREAGPTQHDWNGVLEGFMIAQDLDNTSGKGISFRNEAGTPVKVIDGGVLNRVAAMGWCDEGWEFPLGSITVVPRDLVAFACGYGTRRTFTADTENGSATISNVSSFTGLAVGDLVSGPGVADGAQITGLNPGGGTLTVNRIGTTAGTGVAAGNGVTIERIGAPGVRYVCNNADLPHFEGLSGDQNSGGLIRLVGSGSGSVGAVKFTTCKNEFGVNAYRGGTYNPATTPSVPQGRWAIVLDGMRDTPVRVDGLLHWADANSSVGGSLPNALGTWIGAPILDLNTSIPAPVEWTGLRVNLAAGSGQTSRSAYRSNWSSTYLDIPSNSSGRGTNKHAPLPQRVFADVNAVLSPHDVLAAWSSLSAARTCQLPGISEVATGYPVTMIDMSGSATGTITLTATPKGSDTISGPTIINTAYGRIDFISDGTKWIASERTAYAPSDPDALTAGESTMSPREVTSSATLTSGVMRTTFFTAQRTETISQVRIITAGTAAGATPTLVRVGVFEVAANGDMTLVASTASDTSLLATQNTAYPKALQDSFVKKKGVRYGVGALVVTGATAPVVQGQVVGTGSTLAGGPPRIAAFSGLSDLPASESAAAIAGSLSTSRIYVELLP